MARKNRRAYGPKIDPRPVDPSISIVDVVDQTWYIIILLLSLALHP